MKVAISHSSTSAFLRPPFLARSSLPLHLGFRLRLGFRETAAVAMSGMKEPDPDPLLQQSPPSKNQGVAVAEAEKNGASKQGEFDLERLQKQLGEPPEKPLPGDCCGSGCVRCIWDIYFEELDLYNSRKAALDAARASQ